MCFIRGVTRRCKCEHPDCINRKELKTCDAHGNEGLLDGHGSQRSTGIVAKPCEKGLEKGRWNNTSTGNYERCYTKKEVVIYEMGPSEWCEYCMKAGHWKHRQEERFALLMAETFGSAENQEAAEKRE